MRPRKGARITLRAHREEAWVILEVEDNGPGLAQEQISRVFERFYRASDAPGGAGLGLAIVQEIAHRHGGQARVRAVQPQGLLVQILVSKSKCSDADTARIVPQQAF